MTAPAHQPIKLENGLQELLGSSLAYDHVESAVAILDVQAKLRYGNPAFLKFNHAVRDAIENLYAQAALLDCPQFRAWLQAAAAGSKVESLRQEFYYSHRIKVELTVCARPVQTKTGKTEGIMLSIGEESVDFNDRHIARAQDAFRSLANRIRTLNKEKNDGDRLVSLLLTKLPVAIVQFNDQRQIMQINRAAEKLFGGSATRLIGHTCEMILPCYQTCGACPAFDLNRVIDAEEIMGLTLDQRSIPLLRSVTVITDDDGKRSIIEAFMDMTEHAKAEEAIHNLAFYDPLTNLPNRRLMMDRLQQSMAASTRNQQHGAILCLDLDNFKTLNDTRGHDIGDLLLHEVANRLLGCVREGDTVARFGGDEFVLILNGLSTRQDEAAAQAEMIAEKIRASLAQSSSLKELDHYCTASIGINLYIDHQGSMDELFKQADVAMYQAKQAGRNAIRFFDPTMQAALEARSKVEEALRWALPHKQFCLHYQIQVGTHRKPIGAEALLRWNHPQLGLVAPARFIPLAEENGLILPIGLWVLESACEQIRLWQSDPVLSELSIAINVSARQFRHEDFVSQVETVLGASAINPKRLKFELTESLILNNVEDSIKKMQQLKKIGVDFAMDDFGTGYSSLSYLKRLPLDQIKIDQTFVRDISTDASDAVIVQTIIAMANTLGLKIIAEGVETEAQHEFLELSGCPSFQGHLFGEAMPVKQLEAIIREKAALIGN